ncbi:cyclin-like protein [Vermiconidia calcicola]|uniref:Cyclin-like protein n=1 Tax=Vermiconidia calcicola TaxID=1690605 RepID=A0ACC3N288_9PEZI|nr:cyclin-like protein [Vermiconidia calcicola]
MPAFYSRQMGSQLPLTPPDSGSGYGYSSMHYSHDPYAAQQGMSQPRHDSTYDYQQTYMQPSVAPGPPTYQYPQSSYQPANSLPPIQSYYEPIGAPILPPLRIQDRVSFADDYNRRLQQEQQTAAAREQQRQASKDEKATGGVSAKLDYDMEHMTDFVTEATQSIMQSLPSFRKWVHQVLSATRLPSATILLSLHYLNDRVANFPETVQSGENQIYRMLAVSLILGSKFLDDNTFINRSWSDVTAIKVTELNLLEMQWLQLINYELHIDPDAQNGLQAWLDAWKDYEAKYVAKQQQSTRLSPLDTTVYRHSSSRADRYSPYPTPHTAGTSRAYDASQSSRAAQLGATPYMTADPWGQTDRHALDDFYKRQHRYPTLTEIDDVNRRVSEERARQSAFAYPQSAQTSYYQPNIGNGWDQQAWNGAHRYDCGCSTCTYQHHYRPYPMASSYTAQTVMG